jgi:tetratricopeptide (TPR) repeat protein
MKYLKTDLITRVLFFDQLKNPDFTFEIGNYYFGMGSVYNPVMAIKYYKETIALQNNYPRAHYQLSRVYFVIGKQDIAREEINKELELFPDYSRSFYIRGLVNGYTGRLNEAVSDFKNFLAWKPESWAGHNDLAWIYFQKGDFYNAYLTAEDGLKYSENNPWLLNAIGVSLKNTDNEEEALKAFETSLKVVSNMKSDEWGSAYPGNDPSFYDTGLANMKTTIEKNISLIKNKKQTGL